MGELCCLNEISFSQTAGLSMRFIARNPTVQRLLFVGSPGNGWSTRGHPGGPSQAMVMANHDKFVVAHRCCQW